jgi:hypothetical protein
MTDTRFDFVPAYAIPLTDKQLVTVGRITAIWAQVDFFVDRLLMLVLDLNPPDFNTRFGTMMVGSKIDELDLSHTTISDDERRRAVHFFVTVAQGVKRARNHVAHGMWGTRHAGGKEFVAARMRKNPGEPFRAERLRKSEKDVASASRAGANAVAVWTGIVWMAPANLHFGSKATPPARLGLAGIPVPSGRPIPDHNPKGKAPRPRPSEG